MGLWDLPAHGRPLERKKKKVLLPIDGSPWPFPFLPTAARIRTVCQSRSKTRLSATAPRPPPSGWPSEYSPSPKTMCLASQLEGTLASWQNKNQGRKRRHTAIGIHHQSTRWYEFCRVGASNALYWGSLCVSGDINSLIRCCGNRYLGTCPVLTLSQLSCSAERNIASERDLRIWQERPPFSLSLSLRCCTRTRHSYDTC